MSLMKPEDSLRIGVAILAKAPIAGLAKTRLIPHLGADGAAALQRWLLQRTVAAAVIADLGPVTLWCAPRFITPSSPFVAHSVRLSYVVNRTVTWVSACMPPLPNLRLPQAPW